MKKTFGKGRHHSSDEMTLQITSMADIFTILLVFLLKSFATSAVNVTPSPGMKLPEGTAAEAPVEALKVEVSQTGVVIEGQPISALKDFRFESSDLQPNGASNSLNKALQQERKRQIMIAKVNSDVKIDAKIIIVADQRTPYSTIKSVLASAALNGYTDFKLAVVKGD